MKLADTFSLYAEGLSMTQYTRNCFHKVQAGRARTVFDFGVPSENAKLLNLRLTEGLFLFQSCVSDALRPLWASSLPTIII